MVKVKAPTCAAAGREGGRLRSARLSEERRREIASDAGREAARARRGLVTRKQIAAAYLAELKRRDPDLARLVKIGMSAPDRYAEAMERILTPEEWAHVIQAYSIACSGLTAEAQP